MGYDIAIDFDGTIVEHEYPSIGPAVPYAIPVMWELQEMPGVRLYLWTMRSGDQLEEAVHFMAEARIKLAGVNSKPEQKTWTDSPKLYANLYIDDAAYGTPLIMPPHGRRAYVDWTCVREFVLNDILRQRQIPFIPLKEATND